MREDRRLSTAMSMAEAGPQIERHPWQPFVPPRAKVLIMGTFPPKSTRWSMDFYYPNRINDFWRVMGLIFFDNPERFWDGVAKTFLLDDIRNFLTEHRIAMNDTGAAVRRLRDNASDKFLEIVEPVDLDALLSLMPECSAIATTGEKAAGVIAQLTHTAAPKLGEYTEFQWPRPGAESLRTIRHWRMPSTSRAYPLPLAAKADYYRRMFADTFPEASMHL